MQIEWISAFWSWLIEFFAQPVGLAFSALIAAIVSGLVTLGFKAIDRPIPRWDLIVENSYWGFDAGGDMHGPAARLKIINTGAGPAHRVRFVGFHCGNRRLLSESWEVQNSLSPHLHPDEHVDAVYEVHSRHWDSAGVLVTWSQIGLLQSRMETKYQFLRISEYVTPPSLMEQIAYDHHSGEYIEAPAALTDADAEFLRNRDAWLLEQKHVFERQISKCEDKKLWKKLSKQPWGKLDASTV